MPIELLPFFPEVGGTAEPGKYGREGRHNAVVVEVIGGFTTTCNTSTLKPTVGFTTKVHTLPAGIAARIVLKTCLQHS